MNAKTKIIIILIVIALLIILFVQNTQVVTYNIFFWKIAVSSVILIPLILVIGFLLGFIVAGMKKKYY